MLVTWKKSYDKPRQCIKNQRYHLANKGLYSESYGFSSSHVQMWELDHKEGWMPKNLCFQNYGAREESWESLGWQGDQTSQSSRKSTLNIHWKDWCWNWTSNILATWAKSWFIGKDPDVGKYWSCEEKGTREDEMASSPQWT